MRKSLLSAMTVLGLTAVSANGVENPLFGVVNFGTCITDSKVGKKEQENMENMRKQMTSMIEEREKEYKEIAAKLEDSEYLDSLSPKAEEELKNRFQALQEELGQSQNQYYQILQHTQYQVMNKMNASIAKASEKIAKEKNLAYVINENLCYYVRPDMDVTLAVIGEMDKSFDQESQTNKKLSEDSEEFHSIDSTLPEDPGAKAG